jgi:protein-S-isoprenylcysteine O-methyltransferase Ste14
MIYWFAAIAETAIIFAQFAPRSTSSQLLISTLAFGGEITTIQLNSLRVLGSFLIVGGAALRLYCYHTLGTYFTFETAIVKNHALVTTGPYAWVRHPSYTGAVLAYLGLICYYGCPGSWFMECLMKGTAAGAIFGVSCAIAMSLVVTGLLSRISKEDEGLKREFGKEWQLWADAVPYVLIPGVY